MKLKIQNEENKLTIRMKKDFYILNKTIHLHENAIKSIQGHNFYKFIFYFYLTRFDRQL